MARQTGLTEDLAVKCPSWNKNGISQTLDCTVTHAGQEIAVQVRIDGDPGFARYETQQDKTFFSASAVRKAFDDYAAQYNYTVIGCDDGMPELAIVEFDMPLPYTCTSKSSYGTKQRHTVEIGDLGIRFTLK